MIKRILLAVLLTPLIVILAPIVLVVLVPVIVVIEVKAGISLRLFRRREAGNFYLICTSHRGWYDFLRNNVIPVLPSNVRVVWHKAKRGAKCPRLFDHLYRSRIFNVAKPYLVAVTSRALLHKSLNERLQCLKTQAKISEDVRRACGEAIVEAQEELRGRNSVV